MVRVHRGPPFSTGSSGIEKSSPSKAGANLAEVRLEPLYTLRFRYPEEGRAGFIGGDEEDVSYSLKAAPKVRL